MAKGKVTDLRRRYYPELAPDRDYPPLRRLADRRDPSYKA
jgi:hypothetical protein